MCDIRSTICDTATCVAQWWSTDTRWISSWVYRWHTWNPSAYNSARWPYYPHPAHSYRLAESHSCLSTKRKLALRKNITSKIKKIVGLIIVQESANMIFIFSEYICQCHVRVSCHIPSGSQQGIHTHVDGHNVSLVVHVAGEHTQHARSDAHNDATRTIHIVNPASHRFPVGGDHCQVD